MQVILKREDKSARGEEREREKFTFSFFQIRKKKKCVKIEWKGKLYSSPLFHAFVAYYPDGRVVVSLSLLFSFRENIQNKLVYRGRGACYETRLA